MTPETFVSSLSAWPLLPWSMMVQAYSRSAAVDAAEHDAAVALGAAAKLAASAAPPAAARPARATTATAASQAGSLFKRADFTRGYDIFQLASSSSTTFVASCLCFITEFVYLVLDVATQYRYEANLTPRVALRALNALNGSAMLVVWSYRWKLGPTLTSRLLAALLVLVSCGLYAHAALVPDDTQYAFALGLWSFGIKGGACGSHEFFVCVLTTRH
jgi:hypothetical protein